MFLAFIPMLGTAWRFLMTPIGKGLMVLLVVAGAYLTGYWKGDNHRDQIWKAKIAIERTRQSHIIADADAEALKEIKRLTEEKEQQEAQINELLAEADKDPNALRPAVGIDGVRRINRIGPRGPH